ncbi:MAG: TetR/AcrR family transcriptional regulator [Gemmatimonadetes bacterium]|nr:TetR/AcrR family transcriptional regulator [Gemmatimonadota bacterium]NNK63628.1 TetR/AcrR family transcriptional regulator [Gemmatimonadota bacterium]
MRAGRELFAEQGYDGASVRAITSRAEANLGAITYHFGSKQALYHEVLRSMVVPLRDRVAEVASRDAPPLDRLDAVVEAYFRHFAAHGDLPRFLMERIAAGQLPPPPVAVAMKSILGTLAGLVREGQRQGSVRDGDPVLLSLSLIAQPVYLTLVQTPLRDVLGLDLADTESFERLVDHARAFVRAGLTASPLPDTA